MNRLIYLSECKLRNGFNEISGTLWKNSHIRCVGKRQLTSIKSNVPENCIKSEALPGYLAGFCCIKTNVRPFYDEKGGIYNEGLRLLPYQQEAAEY